MAFQATYEEASLSRAEVDLLPGAAVLEFGTNWCGVCAGFTPQAAVEFAIFSEIRHIRVLDGPGKPLGRSYRVKLWPTFVLLRDGRVTEQLVRPIREQLHNSLAALTSDT